MPVADFEIAVPATMRAAVYKGDSVVAVEQVPTPGIGAGELLVRVEACGVCHTDLKKIEYNLLAPPRIYGHETAGVVVRTGRDVRGPVLSGPGVRGALVKTPGPSIKDCGIGNSGTLSPCGIGSTSSGVTITSNSEFCLLIDFDVNNLPIMGISARPGILARVSVV